MPDGCRRGGFNRSLVEHTNKTNSLLFRLDTIRIFTHIL